jgi:malonyl-CoA O-methyltransferase
MDRARIRRLFSRPARELEPLEAYELWAGSYDQREGNALLYAEEKALALFVDRPLIAGRDVLDAGCGTGRNLSWLQAFQPHSITATDLSPSMLDRAREKVADVRFHVCPVDRLPFPDGSFDVVLCTLVLSHVENLSAAIGELARVLRRGGSLVITDVHPIGKLLGWQRTFTAGKKHYAVKYSMHLHSGYFNAFQAAGLKIVMIDEPKIDGSLEKFYVAANRRDIYRTYLNYPILLLFRVVKK